MHPRSFGALVALSVVVAAAATVHVDLSTLPTSGVYVPPPSAADLVLSGIPAVDSVAIGDCLASANRTSWSATSLSVVVLGDRLVNISVCGGTVSGSAAINGSSIYGLSITDSSMASALWTSTRSVTVTNVTVVGSESTACALVLAANGSSTSWDAVLHNVSVVVNAASTNVSTPLCGICINATQAAAAVVVRADQVTVNATLDNASAATQVAGLRIDAAGGVVNVSLTGSTFQATVTATVANAAVTAAVQGVAIYSFGALDFVAASSTFSSEQLAGQPVATAPTAAVVIQTDRLMRMLVKNVALRVLTANATGAASALSVQGTEAVGAVTLFNLTIDLQSRDALTTATATTHFLFSGDVNGSLSLDHVTFSATTMASVGINVTATSIFASLLTFTNSACNAANMLTCLTLTSSRGPLPSTVAMANVSFPCAGLVASSPVASRGLRAVTVSDCVARSAVAVDCPNLSLVQLLGVNFTDLLTVNITGSTLDGSAAGTRVAVVTGVAFCTKGTACLATSNLTSILFESNSVTASPKTGVSLISLSGGLTTALLQYTRNTMIITGSGSRSYEGFTSTHLPSSVVNQVVAQQNTFQSSGVAQLISLVSFDWNSTAVGSSLTLNISGNVISATASSGIDVIVVLQFTGSLVDLNFASNNVTAFAPHRNLFGIYNPSDAVTVFAATRWWVVDNVLHCRTTSSGNGGVSFGVQLPAFVLNASVVIANNTFLDDGGPTTTALSNGIYLTLLRWIDTTVTVTNNSIAIIDTANATSTNTIVAFQVSGCSSCTLATNCGMFIERNRLAATSRQPLIGLRHYSSFAATSSSSTVVYTNASCEPIRFAGNIITVNSTQNAFAIIAVDGVTPGVLPLNPIDVIVTNNTLTAIASQQSFGFSLIAANVSDVHPRTYNSVVLEFNTVTATLTQPQPSYITAPFLFQCPLNNAPGIAVRHNVATTHLQPGSDVCFLFVERFYLANGRVTVEKNNFTAFTDPSSIVAVARFAFGKIYGYGVVLSSNQLHLVHGASQVYLLQLTAAVIMSSGSVVLTRNAVSGAANDSGVVIRSEQVSSLGSLAGLKPGPATITCNTQDDGRIIGPPYISTSDNLSVWPVASPVVIHECTGSTTLSGTATRTLSQGSPSRTVSNSSEVLTKTYQRQSDTPTLHATATKTSTSALTATLEVRRKKAKHTSATSSASPSFGLGSGSASPTCFPTVTASHSHGPTDTATRSHFDSTPRRRRSITDTAIAPAPPCSQLISSVVVEAASTNALTNNTLSGEALQTRSQTVYITPRSFRYSSICSYCFVSPFFSVSAVDNDAPANANGVAALWPRLVQGSTLLPNGTIAVFLIPNSQLSVLSPQLLEFHFAATSLGCALPSDTDFLITTVLVTAFEPAVVTRTKAILTATAASSAAVAVVGGGAAAVADLQSLTALSYVACASTSTTQSTKTNAWLLAPLTLPISDPNAGAALGSILLLVAMTLLHATAVAVVRWLASLPMRDAQAALRFPALSLMACTAALPGVTLLSLKSLWELGINAAALVALVAALAVPPLQWLLARGTAGAISFMTSDPNHLRFYRYTSYDMVVARLAGHGRAATLLRYFVPLGYWGPKVNKQRVGAIVGAYRQVWACFMAPLASVETLLFFIVASLPTTSRDMCYVQFSLMTLIRAGFAFQMFLTRPFRVPFTLVLRCLGAATVCATLVAAAVAASDADANAGALTVLQAATLVLTMLSVAQLLLSVFTMLLERRLLRAPVDGSADEVPYFEGSSNATMVPKRLLVLAEALRDPLESSDVIEMHAPRARPQV